MTTVKETRSFLEQIRRNFLESVYVTTVGTSLVAADIITSEQLERVFKQSTTPEQRLYLYHCLYNCPQPNTVESVKKALLAAKQGFIIDTVESAIAEKNDCLNKNCILQKLKYTYNDCYSYVAVLAWDRIFERHITDLWINLSLETPIHSFFMRKVGGKSNPYENFAELLLRKFSDVVFKPQLILVTGSAGIGKTTLIKRLAYDWSTQEENDKIIITVPLRNLTGTYKTLDEMVRESLQSNLQKEDAVDVERVLDEALKSAHITTDELLVLLDGWDEFSGRCDELDKIIQRKRYLRYSVLITCRQRDRRILRCDKEIELPGFTSDQIAQYVDSIVFKDQPFYANSIRKFLDENPKMQQVAKVPLLLNHLCAVCEFRAGKIPDTAKKLFDDVIRCFLHKSAQTNEISGDPEKIFTPNHWTELGKLAFAGLLEKRYQWLDSEASATDELKFAIRIGFLTTSSVPVLYSKENTVSFIHQSFQEYFAACYAAKHKETENVVDFLRKIANCDELAKQYELFINFMEECNDLN